MKVYRGKGARLILDVVREPDPDRPAFPSTMTCAADVATVVRGLQATGRVSRERESVGVLLLDQRHKILGVHVASVGTVAQAPFCPREVFRPAIVAGAAAIALWHTHPSGNPSPSHEDRLVTKRMMDSGDLLGIVVLDHVIVADRTHYSFAESQ